MLAFFRTAFNTVDRVLGIASLVISVISLLVTILLVEYPEAIPQFIVVRDFLIVIVLISWILIIGSRYVRKCNEIVAITSASQESIRSYEVTAKNAQQKLQVFTESVINYNHALTHNTRDAIAKYFNGRKNGDSLPPQIFLGEMLYSLTSTYRNELLAYFGSIGKDVPDLSISVKLIHTSEAIKKRFPNFSPEDCEYVITAYRDPNTYDTQRNKREVLTALYKVGENSAFQIPRDAATAIWVSDNLRADRSYRNKTPNWQDLYNATIVVSIRYELDRRKPEKEIKCLGYLTADSMNRQNQVLFEDEQVKMIGSKYADFVCSAIILAQSAEN